MTFPESAHSSAHQCQYCQRLLTNLVFPNAGGTAASKLWACPLTGRTRPSRSCVQRLARAIERPGARGLWHAERRGRQATHAERVADDRVALAAQMDADPVGPPRGAVVPSGRRG